MAVRNRGEKDMPYEVGRLIGRAKRYLSSMAAQRLASANESIYSWQLLAFTVRYGGLSQRELAAMTSQHPAGVSRGLVELERRGLVRRTRDRQDRRRSLVEATPKGLERYRELFPLVAEAVDQALRPLSARERLQLHTILSKLVPTAEQELRGR
jgi:DNA-binding MarR family transcriptional regulator